MFSADANTIFKIQILTAILAVVGSFFVEFNVLNLSIAVISFYIYSIIGISLTLHRYYSHKSFNFRSNILKWICTFISLLSGRGSPLGWVYVHRLHHAYSDTDKDPHPPHLLGFKLFGFKHIDNHSKKINLFLIKDLMIKEQIFINKWYFAIIFLWLLFLSFFSFELVFFSWIIPVMLIQLSQNSFNYFCHLKGYKNFDNKDKSTNNIFMWPFILGDAWHNNHHHNPKLYFTKYKKWEVDPVAKFINIIKS